jgi:hypothetical protein
MRQLLFVVAITFQPSTTQRRCQEVVGKNKVTRKVSFESSERSHIDLLPVIDH